ncbi:MAG: RNA methyltransferase [Flavobacteriales bacterium]
MNKKLKLWELNRVSPEEFSKQEKLPVVVVLDDLRSFENVGSVFRTSDAFNIQEIILCGITPVPPHREIHRTALGATDTVKWTYIAKATEAIVKLKSEGYTIYALEQAEKTIMLQHLKKSIKSPIALVFGNEVNGVNQDVIDQCHAVLEIPQFGTKHSLNVSVCVGVVLWECATVLNPSLNVD